MHGFVKVGAAVPKVKVAACKFNAVQIIEKVKEAWKQKVAVLVLPELVITGYTCGDLFFQKTLLNGAMRGLEEILNATKEMSMLIAVGMPIAMESEIFNCSVMIFEGKIVGVVPKQFIPNYNEFYEKRWFAAGEDLKCKQIEILGQEVPVGCDLLIKLREVGTIGVEMCEDV